MSTIEAEVRRARVKLATVRTPVKCETILPPMPPFDRMPNHTPTKADVPASPFVSIQYVGNVSLGFSEAKSMPHGKCELTDL